METDKVITEEQKAKILTLMDTEEGRRRIDEILDAAAATTNLFVQASRVNVVPIF